VLGTNNLPLWQILSKTYLDTSWAGTSSYASEISNIHYQSNQAQRKFFKLLIYKSSSGCQDISRDISFLLLLPLSPCLLHHLLSATSLFQDVKTSHVTSSICSPCLHAPTAASSSSLHHSSVIISSSSLPLNVIQLPLKLMNHAYIVSYCHTSYIVSYYSKSCIIASIILLLPLFRHKFGKSRMHEINVQILQTSNNELFKGTCPYI